MVQFASQFMPSEPQGSGLSGTPISLESLHLQLAALEKENTRRSDSEHDLVEPLACAATLVEFDPALLLAAFGMANKDENLDRLEKHFERSHRNDRLIADERRLTQAARRRALAAIGQPLERLRELRRRVEIPVPGTLQRMADLLLDDAPLPPSPTLGELAALAEAHEWYRGILPWLPPVEPLRRRLAMAQLLEPMQRLIGDEFVGRKYELDRLADYVGVLKSEGILASVGVSARRLVRRARRTLFSDPPLFVVGPGGVGKSSLMARFILDHVDSTRDTPMPFVLVDFDRAQVEPSLPLSLLLTGLQQLRVQFPAHHDAIARISESLAARMRVGDAQEFAKSSSLQETVVMEFARQVDLMLGDDPTPLLWVLDTFEEPQRMGESTVGPLWELMDTLQRYLSRLRLVVCGRVVPPGFTWDLVPLDEFDPPSALAYLRKRLNQIGAAERADDATLRRVITLVGRSPLVLRLAARLIAEEDPQLLMLKVRRERILAVLFHRVLDHIRVHEQFDVGERVDAVERAKLQDELARLVFPGLAVRRITPGVIRHVLAKPCGIKMRDPQHADRLFKALRQQVDIVDLGEHDAGEPNLLHRSDLRRMMLRDLDAKAGSRTVERISRRAVRYHQSLASPGHRAEEIYHRLRLVQTEATIRARWLPEAKPYLLGALDDMERPAMRVLLADLLGVTLDADTLRNAAQEDWERQTERRASEYLRSGSPLSTLQILRERPQRLYASPLLGLEAQAYHLLGEFTHAAMLARRAFDECAQSGDMAAACDAALLLALAEEAEGGFEEAHARVGEALEMARALGNHILLLRAEVALLRLERRRWRSEEELEPLVQELNLLLDTETLRELRRRPALLRELLAELGALNPKLLRIGVDVLGIDLPSYQDAIMLSSTLATWSEQGPGPAADIARAFGVAFDALLPTVVEWTEWLWRSGSTTTGQLVLALLRALPPETHVLEGLANLYQHEVQRRIVRAEVERVL